MCVYSFVMDHYSQKWGEIIPQVPVSPVTPPIFPVYPTIPVSPQPQITSAELEEFRDLLEKARKYDRERGEPDCELDEKKQKLKDLAKQLGVEINFL